MNTLDKIAIICFLGGMLLVTHLVTIAVHKCEPEKIYIVK